MQTESEFLQGGGECGAIIRSMDWHATALGNPADWPPVLQITLSTILASGFPMALYWGPQYISFYNDAYQPRLQRDGKHPAAIGKPASEIWPEVWHLLQPDLDAVTATGTAKKYEDRAVPTRRNGVLKDTYWTYSISPVRNEAGITAGLLMVCFETTPQVINKKRLEKKNDWLQMALAAADMGTWDMNLATNTIQTSELTKILFGLPPNEDVDLMQAFNQVIPQDKSRVVDAIKRAIYHGENYDTSYTVVMPDGTERIVNAKGKLYHAPGGMPDRFAGIVQDITKETTVRRQQQQLASLVENSSDAMAIAAIDGQMLYANHACRRLIGLSDAADVTQYTNKDFYSEAEYERVSLLIIPPIETHGKWEGPVSIRHFQTGETIPCYQNTVRILDSSTGQTVACGVSIRDLRPEQAAQEALKESGERLALSLEAADMGTFDWLLKEDRLTWDNRCRQLFGLANSAEVTYGSTFLNGLHPSDREATEAEVAKAFNPSGNGRYFARYRTIDSNGQFLYWVDASGRLYFDENRIPYRFIGTVIDVTEQVNASQDIAERDARFRLLGNTVGQLVWMANTGRQLLYLNKAGYQYTGLTDAELDVDSWQRLIHPDDKQAYLRQWDKLQQFTETDIQTEHRLRRKDGEYRWFLTRINAHRDGKEFWINSSTDIQLIKESEERKNDFFQMASHELKTPVTSVKAYAQFLHKQFEKRGDTAASGMLQKMNAQISKLEVLINDLLDVNRMESGKMQFKEDVFYLNDLAQEVIEEVQRTTNKEIQLSLAPTEDTMVWGDHYRIGQVLTNLLSNAIKYSPGSSRVVVKVWQENDYVHCCVSDFGIGIPHEQQAQLFNRFYRVTGQNTDTFPGLGLGLYISAEIIKRQNGRIQVKSQPQVGSDFCFSLPLIKK